MNMSTGNKNIGLVLLILTAFVLSSCCLKQPVTINIVDVRTAAGITDKLMPLGITSAFPDGTQKVFCWFRWRNAEVNTVVTAQWYFLTDNIHILNYVFAVPRKEGSGSVSLTMPEGKKLPAGQYRIDLNFGKQTLKSVTFKVQ